MKLTSYKLFSPRCISLRKAAVAIVVISGFLALTSGSAQVGVLSQMNQISNISYAANSFSIGNAYKGWLVWIEGSPTCNGDNHTTYYCYLWGYIGGTFQRCGWIGQRTQAKHQNARGAWNPCGIDGTKIPSDKQHRNFFPIYTDGFYNSNPGGGTPTLYDYDSSNPYGAKCQSPGYAYGNVDPWKNPTTPSDPFPIGNDIPVEWRYITLDNRWTMVHLTHPVAGEPSWVFVGSWCLKDPALKDPQNANYGYPDLVYYPTQGGDFGRSADGKFTVLSNQQNYIRLYQFLSRATRHQERQYGRTRAPTISKAQN